VASIRGRAHWSVRAFRILLALYPGEFRDEYGRELALVFADRYRDAPDAWQRARVWCEAVAGVVREAPKEHGRLLMQDLRYAARVLFRSPAFAITAVLTLALGVGANSAIFHLIDAVRLRTLPVRNPGELAEVRIVGGNDGFGINPGRYGQLPQPVWRELRAHQQAFSDLFGWSMWEMRVGEPSNLRRVTGLLVSGEFFPVLGVRPWRGRLFEPADEARECPAPRAVVSHAFWQREFGDRELTSDARLILNGETHEIIGITPPAFFGLAVGETFDVAKILCNRADVRRDVFDLSVMGRLRPGWTMDRASAHLEALSVGIFEATAPTGYSTRSIERFKKFRLGAYAASTGVSSLRKQYDTALQLLLAITGLVLLIACANLANLMLARSIAREREVSVRLALGASRTRLLRQFLAESGLIAGVGALFGVALAQVLSRALLWALSTTQSAPNLLLEPSWRVLMFTGAVAAATCFVFGAAPAIRATRVQPASAMAWGRGMTSSRERFSARRVMVVAQIAISLVLLVAALLFVRSFRNLVTFDAGMRREGITVAFFRLPAPIPPPERINQLHRQLLAGVQAIPGILDAATTTNVPLTGNSWGHGVRVGETEGSAMFTWVSPGYFKTMGIPIREGRGLTLQDTEASPRVAIVNEAFIRQLVTTGQPLGQTLRTSPEPGYPATVYEIVGIIPNTQYSNLRTAPPPMVFAPDSQNPNKGPSSAMMIHSSITPAAAAASVKRQVAASHPGTILEFMEFQTRIRDGLVRERLMAVLAGFFGALAAVLAMVGLYGMISFAVAQRRQELGIRLALGALRSQVIALMMREAARLLAIGIAIGTVASLLAAQSTATLLFGLTPRDPVTLIGASALLTAIAALASFLPARRASRLDPVTSLRQE
jgi:predicted permease